MSTVPELLRGDADTYEAKAEDYAPDPNDPFENFTFAGQFAGRLVDGAALTTTSPEWRRRIVACCVLIGVKISRLMTLGLFRTAKNEGVLDTIRDLRVYLAILEAMLREPCAPVTERARDARHVAGRDGL